MSRDINEQYEPHDKDWVQEQDSKNKLGEKKKKKTFDMHPYLCV